jgi:hypothetical protein
VGVRRYWNSPKWYLAQVALGALILVVALFLPDDRSRNDVVMGVLILVSAGLGYTGSRAKAFAARRILNGVSLLLLLAAVLTRLA